MLHLHFETDTKNRDISFVRVFLSLLTVLQATSLKCILNKKNNNKQRKHFKSMSSEFMTEEKNKKSHNICAAQSKRQKESTYNIAELNKMKMVIKSNGRKQQLPYKSESVSFVCDVIAAYLCFVSFCFASRLWYRSVLLLRLQMTTILFFLTSGIQD